jgi:hypothetical protein
LRVNQDLAAIERIVLENPVPSFKNASMDIMFEILFGSIFMVFALLPKTKFYPGRLGTKQVLPPIEPAWIMRLVFFGIGLGLVLEGVRGRLHH